jgi:purine-nucleoside phosphorylase
MSTELIAALQYLLSTGIKAMPETTAIVLGSGLGAFAERIEHSKSIDAAAIPHYPTPTVAGHHGKIIFGTLAKSSVVLIQGRVHLYENRRADEVTFYVGLLHALGVKTLVLTNAAGGINPHFDTGNLCLITDHLKLQPRVHLNMPTENLSETSNAYRLPVYDRALCERMRQTARDQKIILKEGVYAGVLGPSYETKAEIRMLAALGADLVGMSTVVEALAASRLGMRTVAVSLITNKAAGLSDEKLSHDDVQHVAKQAQDQFSQLIENFVLGLAINVKS